MLRLAMTGRTASAVARRKVRVMVASGADLGWMGAAQGRPWAVGPVWARRAACVACSPRKAVSRLAATWREMALYLA